MSDTDSREQSVSQEEYVGALRVQLDDYQTVVAHQLDWAARIDEISTTISRYIIALLAVLVTLISVVPNRFPTNLAVFLGLGFVFVAFIGTVVTQTSADIRDGTQPQHGRTLIAQTTSEQQWLERLVRDYSQWIETNNETLSGYITFLLVSQLALIAGLLVLAIGLVIGFVR